MPKRAELGAPWGAIAGQGEKNQARVADWQEIEARLARLDEGVSIERILAEDEVEIREVGALIGGGRAIVASELQFRSFLVVLRVHRVFSPVIIHAGLAEAALDDCGFPYYWQEGFVFSDGKFFEEPAERIWWATYNARMFEYEPRGLPELPKEWRVVVDTRLSYHETKDLCLEVMGGGLGGQIEIRPPRGKSFFL